MRSALFGLLGLLLACETPTTRVDLNKSAAQVEITNTLEVRVFGAAIIETAHPQGQIPRVEVRAQSLDVRIEVETSGCGPEAVVIALRQLGDDAHVSAERRTLLDGESRALAAARRAAGPAFGFIADADDVDRSPLDEVQSFTPTWSDDRLVWTVIVDRGQRSALVEPGEMSTVPTEPTGACASLLETGAGSLANAGLLVRHRLRRALPEGGFQFAVWGNNAGDRTRRRALIDAVNAEPNEFVVISGDLTESGGSEALSRAAEQLNGLEIPWFATLGDRDLLGEASETYIADIGRSDFAFDAGAVRIIVVDSADRTLKEQTYDLLDKWLPQESLWWPSVPSPPNRVMITHVPPFEPYGSRGAAFVNRTEAARLIGALSRSGVSHLLTSNLGIYAVKSYGGVRVVHSGGAGGALEDLTDSAHHWLRVRVGADCQAPAAEGAAVGAACAVSTECLAGAFCEASRCTPCVRVEPVPIP